MKLIRTVLSAYRAAYAGLPREVWSLSGALLVNHAATMVLPFLSLYLTRDLDLSAANAVVAERAGAESVGRYMGIYTLAFSTAFVVGPIAGTAIYHNSSPQTLWYGTGVVGVALAIAFAALSRPLRSHQLPGNPGLDH